MPLRHLICTLLFVSGLALPAVAQQEPDAVDTEAAQAADTAEPAPPAPRYEAVHGSHPGYVWAPGYWSRHNRSHTWVNGHWIVARPGYNWVADHWAKRGKHWHLITGHWVVNPHYVPPTPNYNDPHVWVFYRHH